MTKIYTESNYGFEQRIVISSRNPITKVSPLNLSLLQIFGRAEKQERIKRDYRGCRMQACETKRF